MMEVCSTFFFSGLFFNQAEPVHGTPRPLEHVFENLDMFIIHTQKHLTQGQAHREKSWGMGAIRTTILVKKPGPLPLALAQCLPPAQGRYLKEAIGSRANLYYHLHLWCAPCRSLASWADSSTFSDHSDLSPRPCHSGGMQSPFASVSGREIWGSYLEEY